MDITRIILSNKIRRFVIETAEQNIGVKLDDDKVDDGYLVLNDEQDLIAEIAFKGVDFILLNETGETELKFCVYARSTDSVDVQSANDKCFSTGNALVYAQGLPDDSEEIKAKKLESILALRDFRVMCEALINE